MRYQGTAVQIYEMPSPSGPDVHINQRMALIVSTIGLIALLALVGFLMFGLLSQRL